MDAFHPDGGQCHDALLKGFPVHDGHADAECARSLHLQLGRVRQLFARHAAMDGSVRQR